MAVHTDALVRMANQIGTFFDAMPDRPEALESIAEHLKKFWDPRMRHALLAQLDAGGDIGLSPTVAEAISRHRTLLQRPPGAIRTAPGADEA